MIEKDSSTIVLLNQDDDWSNLINTQHVSVPTLESHIHTTIHNILVIKDLPRGIFRISTYLWNRGNRLVITTIFKPSYRSWSLDTFEVEEAKKEGKVNNLTPRKLYLGDRDDRSTTSYLCRPLTHFNLHHLTSFPPFENTHYSLFASLFQSPACRIYLSIQLLAHGPFHQIDHIIPLL